MERTSYELPTRMRGWPNMPRPHARPPACLHGCCRHPTCLSYRSGFFVATRSYIAQALQTPILSHCSSRQNDHSLPDIGLYRFLSFQPKVWQDGSQLPRPSPAQCPLHHEDRYQATRKSRCQQARSLGSQIQYRSLMPLADTLNAYTKLQRMAKR